MVRFDRVRSLDLSVASSASTVSSSRSTKCRRVHNSPGMSTRGEHLVRADRRFATGGGVLARLTAPAIISVLEEIDSRLSSGGLEAMLPDGSRRRLGFRSKGPRARVHIVSWMALVR